MNRRHLLQIVGLLTIAPSLAFESIFFIEPITVITIALSIAKLFGGLFQDNGSPTIEDLAKNISDQLNIIDQKFDLLLSETKEIKELIQNLPKEFVVKMNKVQLKARLDDYRAIMTEISLASYKGDIVKYMSVTENRTKVNVLVSQIKEVKGNLRQIDDPFLVPYVAIGVHIEYFLRNNFLQQSWINFVGDIDTDQKWLKKFVFDKEDSVANQLSSLKGTRKLLLSDTTQITAAQVMKQFGGPYFGQSQLVYVYSQKLTTETDKNILEEDELQVLRRNGMLTNDDLPLIFVIKEPEELLIKNSQGEVALPSGYKANTSLSLDQQIQKVNQFKQDNLLKKNNVLKLNYLSIIGTASSFYAGLKAIEFCNIYIKAANLNK